MLLLCQFNTTFDWKMHRQYDIACCDANSIEKKNHIKLTKKGNTQIKLIQFIVFESTGEWHTHTLQSIFFYWNKNFARDGDEKKCTLCDGSHDEKSIKSAHRIFELKKMFKFDEKLENSIEKYDRIFIRGIRNHNFLTILYCNTICWHCLKKTKQKQRLHGAYLLIKIACIAIFIQWTKGIFHHPPSGFFVKEKILCTLSNASE